MMINPTGVFVFDGHGLKELNPLPKRIPIGAWARAGNGCEQLKLLPRHHERRYEWVPVPQEQMPVILRTTLLLLGTA